MWDPPLGQDGTTSRQVCRSKDSSMTSLTPEMEAASLFFQSPDPILQVSDHVLLLAVFIQSVGDTRMSLNASMGGLLQQPM